MTSKKEQKGLSRRAFVKGAAVAAVAGSGVIAGCAPRTATPTAAASENTAAPQDAGKASFEIAPAPITDIKETVEADVVVIGAGDSGLMAALGAAEAGAKVILLEKSEKFNTRGFGNGAIGTKFHKEKNIELDKQQIVNDLMRWSGNKASQRRISLWANNSGPVYDHVIDLATAAGLKIGLFPAGGSPEYPEYATCMIFGDKMDQNDLLAVIEKEAKAKGVDIRYETPAEQLVRENGGRVTAAIAKSKDGSYIQFKAKKAVILATGDYGHNPEMMDKWCAWAKNVDANVYTPAVNTGDGHKMGLWVGGAMQDGPHAPMIHTLGGATMSMNPVLRVNTLGLRYENEDIPNPYICNSRMRQPGNVVWAVFDSKWADEVKNTTPGFGRTVAVSDTTIKGVEDAVAKKNILKADTIEDLAKAMGVPADTFKATVDRYTELAKAGKDEDFGKSANNLWTVDKAPFYATKVAAVLLVTLGGFKVNDNLQVMDAEAKVIPGLYAAGNVAGDFYANDYPVLAAGLSHGRCITEGYLAGQNAAKEA